MDIYLLMKVVVKNMYLQLWVWKERYHVFLCFTFKGFGGGEFVAAM